MSISFAKSRALFLKVRLFSTPVLRLSIRNDFFSELTPIKLAFMVSPPRLFRAVTKSSSLPPFHLKSTVLSPTSNVYWPSFTL